MVEIDQEIYPYVIEIKLKDDTFDHLNEIFQWLLTPRPDDDFAYATPDIFFRCYFGFCNASIATEFALRFG